jgi:hypothetical protein
MRTTALLLVAMLGACGFESADDKIARLEQMRANNAADFVRAKAECDAQAQQFSTRPEVAQACWESLRVTHEATAASEADIDRRIAEIRAAR